MEPTSSNLYQGLYAQSTNLRLSVKSARQKLMLDSLPVTELSDGRFRITLPNGDSLMEIPPREVRYRVKQLIYMCREIGMSTNTLIHTHKQRKEWRPFKNGIGKVAAGVTWNHKSQRLEIVYEDSVRTARSVSCGTHKGAGKREVKSLS